MNGVNILRRSASAEEYVEMRQSVGWWLPEKDVISTGLKHSLFSVCAENNEKIVGYGRIIGDGAFALYIQDIIVKPEYQRLGIGMKIMSEIMKYINEEYSKGTMVCLMSAKGKENFYKKFGFIERPNEKYGAGMIQFTKE